MTKFVILIAIVFSCTNSERASDTLEKAGYTDVETTGYSFSCSDSDDTCTGFKARGPSGQLVEGAVGCGHSIGCRKGCTIRID